MRRRSSPVPAARTARPVTRGSLTAGLPAWISPQLGPPASRCMLPLGRAMIILPLRDKPGRTRTRLEGPQI